MIDILSDYKMKAVTASSNYIHKDDDTYVPCNNYKMFYCTYDIDTNTFSCFIVESLQGNVIYEYSLYTNTGDIKAYLKEDKDGDKID